MLQVVGASGAAAQSAQIAKRAATMPFLFFFLLFLFFFSFFVLPLICCFHVPAKSCHLAEVQGFLACSLDVIYMTMAGQLSPFRGVFLWVLSGPSCAEWASGAFYFVRLEQTLLLFCGELTTVFQKNRLAGHFQLWLHCQAA